jgi:amidohydrolase
MSILGNQSLMDRSRKIFDKVRKIRRHLHAYPELSFEEFKTTEYISEQLRELGLEPISPGLDTGCMVVLGKGGPGVLLRADIDALPIHEKNEVEYASKHPGVMHACGHDVHTACLLGAINLLIDQIDDFRGRIICLFQPGEEKFPGGAIKVLESGVLDNYEIKFAFAQHVHPPLAAGKVGMRPGPYMGSGDLINIKVHGKGGHGALPNKTIDPVTIAASVISQLQQVISRKSDPVKPSVLSFGKLQTNGGSFNVIPNSIEMEGTFRCLDEEWREEGLHWIDKITVAVAEGLGGTAEVQILRGYPVLVNDRSVTEFAAHRARNLLGEDLVVELPQRLSSEDFAYITRHFPSCFYRLGTGFEEEAKNHSVHTDRFDINEQALITGSALLAHLAVESLKSFKN